MEAVMGTNSFRKMGRMMGADRKGVARAVLLLALAAGRVCAAGSGVLPLPQDIFAEAPESNPVIDLTNNAISAVGNSLQPEIPEALTIRNEGGEILYDADKRSLTYDGRGKSVHLITDAGLDVEASSISVNLETHTAVLEGPLVIYQGESLTRAARGSYDWESKGLDIYDVRTKVNGILLRGSRIEYDKDSTGRTYMKIHDAYSSTDDVQTPATWIGAGELTVYPGDYGRLTRLSVASGNHDIAVPIIGWFSFSHSLNPREGYLPQPGTKSIWGAYLLNQYGFLIGNRRIKNGMPVADYILTTHADYRTRRGLATGLDLEDVAMSSKYADMTGLQTYLAFDADSSINPTDLPRTPVRSNRYRVSFRTLWDLPRFPSDRTGEWTLATNANIVSDAYMLRDFFEKEGRVDNQPDNTVRLVRRTERSQLMLLNRFAPNNYYATDQRTELSYYRVRSAIGNSRINYETNNSFGILRQDVPPHERFLYRAALAEVTDANVRNYYARLLNTSSYARLNTTHEFTTSFKVLGFLNVVPKVGAGYSGYYGVDHAGADNRYLGYLGCDFDIKFHRRFEYFRLPWLGWEGLTHVIRPYATFSHCSISSSNELVPRIDTWSSVMGSATNTPMSLDLMGFTGIDGWGAWSIWRLGAQNVLTTTVDMESRTILNWNLFLDYNVENPNTDRQFSNLFSHISFYPSENLRLTLETQTPTIKNGDGFSQYNAYINYRPCSSLEGRVGYRDIDNHPLIEDSGQIYGQAILRINEKYSAAGLWYWEIQEGRMPIQQYSLFRKAGAWYVGATLFLRDNGGKKETGFGLSFTLGETGTALPVNFF